MSQNLKEMKETFKGHSFESGIIFVESEIYERIKELETLLLEEEFDKLDEERLEARIFELNCLLGSELMTSKESSQESRKYKLGNSGIITIDESAKEDFKKLMNWSEEDWELHTQLALQKARKSERKKMSVW